MARRFLLSLALCAAQVSAARCAAQVISAASPAPAPAKSAFRVLYISGSDVYIDGGRTAGLAENMPLILKQDPAKPPGDPANKALEPGVVARLKVISVASTSAVCEVETTARPITTNDVISLTDSDRETIVDKQTLGNTRKYPMVISFSTGDPLDEEVREAQPRPPLPEVNQIRGRIGFDISTIRQVGQAASVSDAYGMVFRADFTRIFGTHWNLNGYWRGQLRTNSSASQATLQDLMNRTYLMSLTYVNPDSNWTAGVGVSIFRGPAALRRSTEPTWEEKLPGAPSPAFSPDPRPIRRLGTTTPSEGSAVSSSTYTEVVSTSFTIPLLPAPAWTC